MILAARCRFWIIACLALATASGQTFRFAVLGDRTGETQPGVYEEAWSEAAAEHPAFVVGTGDTIQGLNDATAENEWHAVDQSLAAYRRIPFYAAPGNHDIWSALSARLFHQHTAHEPHYSFDYRQAHFTILDNSRTEDFAPAEMAFLEKDLQMHAPQPLKFVVSHRPSWLMDAAGRNRNSALQQLARKYGVQTIIAGHLHMMLHVNVDGVEYISMPSAGGHLRGTKKYEDGWFFGYALVEVNGKDVGIEIKELKPPYGRARVTKLAGWNAGGLVERPLP